MKITYLRGRKSIPIELRWQVIAKNKAMCSRCRKKGFVVPCRYGKPTILEIETFKTWINPYDDTFYWAHRAMEFDHIVPLSKGGRTELSNLQILCRKCNRSKGNR